MFNLINNFLGLSKNLKIVTSEFQALKKNTNIEKIFKSIESFSPEAEVRYVGGCVRKILNREVVDDIDLATNLEPKEVIEILKKNGINFYETGKEHGTITAKIENEKYEITSLRSDISTDGRHAKVIFTKSWLEDAKRRDFTINTIYSDLNGNLFDPFNGAQDLKNGKINFVGDPEKRIKEDYLRILRYIRFFLKYSRIDHNKNVIKSINKNLSGISKISSDRLLDEFKKIFKSSNLIKINNDEYSFDTIKLIFPQFSGLTFFKHLNTFSLSKIKEIDFTFILSLLVVDNTDNADYFIYKFNISNKAKQRIINIKNFFFDKNKKNKINTKNLWQIFYKQGKVTLNDILNYKLFTSKKIDKKLIEYMEFFKDKNIPLLPIKGQDLIKKFKIPEGKKVGLNLKIIEDYWLKNNFQITEEEIRKIIKN